MFSNYSLTFALVGTVTAITKDPLLTWKATNKKTHDMDYYVPNFGEDKDIKTTQSNLADSELRLKHRWNVTKEQLNPKKFKDYTVPNFGLDQDIATSHADLAGAEKTLKHNWVLKAKKDLPKPDPINYYVPNFGQDRDINSSFNNLDWAEKNNKHKWVVTAEQLKAEKRVDYTVPDFGLDGDILATRQHQKESETKLKTQKWNPQPYLNYDVQVNEQSSDDESDSDDENVQLSATREPLLTWKPEDPKSHPVDYFVPQFGLDGQIKSSLANTALAEKITGHTWQYIDPKDRPKPHKVDYVVPNFGQDAEVKQTLELATKAEKKLKHKWNFVPKKLRPKDHKVDYYVPNFGDDPEITETNDSEVQAQTEVWSSRLSSQIGEDEATAQIETDAATYRADAEKAQREADAAAAKAAAAEADAQTAADKAVTNDFKDKMKANMIASAAAEAARTSEWAQKDSTTQVHFAATQVEKEKDHAFYLDETRARTQTAYDSDRQSSEAILATAAAEKEANAAAKAARDATEAERVRLEDAVRVENRKYMIDQRLAGMREEAASANINLEKERAKSAALKAAEDAARAKFWAEYEKLHGAKIEQEEKQTAIKEDAVAQAEKDTEIAEAKQAAESKKLSIEAALRTVEETAQADAAAKKAIADQKIAEDVQAAKLEAETKADEMVAKKEANMRAKAIADLIQADKEAEKEAVGKIDEIRSEGNLIKQMEVSEVKVAEAAEGEAKVKAIIVKEQKEKAAIAPPPELIKSMIKESAEKTGIKVTEAGEQLQIIPTTPAAPIDAPKKAKKAAAEITIPAELFAPKPAAATKVQFDDEDFHISI